MEGSSTRNSRCFAVVSTSAGAGNGTAMFRQRITNTEMALHPQISQLGTLRNEFRDTRKVGGPPCLGVTFDVTPKNPYLAWLQRVDEERRMGSPLCQWPSYTEAEND